jgi:hypothetical protein
VFKLIRDIQEILSSNRIKKIDSLTYKNYTVIDNRATELETALKLRYLDHISPPYLNSSEKTKEEIDEIINNTKDLSNDVINIILLIDKDPLIIYKTLLDSHSLEFPQEKFDTLYNILFNIIKETKIYFNRPRPNQVSEFYKIEIPVINTGTHHTPSYPSGHVAYATLAEILLSDLYPELSSKFKEITDKVKLARIKQGVHFDSDNTAAYKFVYSIFDYLVDYSNKVNQT